MLNLCIVYIFVILFCLVSEIEEPPTNFDGQVDVEAFWNSLRLEIIARGLVQSKFVFIYFIHLGQGTTDTGVYLILPQTIS